MNSLYLALRVSTSGHSRKSTPAIKVAVAAVALSVAVMLAAIAVVMGFKEEITRKVLGFNPHIVIKANPELSRGEYLTSLTPSLQKLLDETPYIHSYALSSSIPGILKTDSDFKGIYLRSLSEDYLKDFLKEQLTEGRIPDFTKEEKQIVVSQMAADQLGLKAGDTIPTYFITDEINVTPLRIAGVYNSHFSAYDDIFAYSSLPFIQETGKVKPEEGTAINIYVDNFERVQEYAVDLRRRLDQAYTSGLIYRYYDIDTALTSGANFFSWLSLLDTNVVVILSLMTVVALVTLISGMMILILDKKRFIAVMKALGASNRQIRKIFIWLTLRVAFTGMIIGNAIMLVLLYLQENYHFLPLDADSYYIDFVPVKLSWLSILILNVGVLVVTYLMLLLPSRFVSTIKGTPAE